MGRANLVMRFGFTVLPGVYDVLVGPLMRLSGLSRRPVAPHQGAVFTPNPTGESLRGGWLPDPARAVGNLLRSGRLLRSVRADGDRSRRLG